jgi:hypothetical protein
MLLAFRSPLWLTCCGMTSDEKAIITYLRNWPNTFISGREIARKVGGRRRFEDDRGWAKPILQRMVQNGSIETDQLGQYRTRAEDPKKKEPKKHVSPHILRILRDSGKNFESIVIDDDEDKTSAGS